MFILSKLIGFLLNPLIWIGVSLLLAIAVPKRRVQLLWFGVVLMLVFSNPFIANWAMNLQESARVELDSTNTYRTGVLLTGMTAARIDKPGVHFESGADRFTESLSLYQSNIIDKIIITGGSGLIDDQDYSESPLLASLALKYGIPDTVILLETKSRNTFENALFTKPLIDSLEVNNCLIITSAFHMDRSLKCFKKVGINAIGYPTDFRASTLDFSIYSFVPSTGALGSWETLLHEWFGLAYYKLKGYI